MVGKVKKPDLWDYQGAISAAGVVQGSESVDNSRKYLRW